MLMDSSFSLTNLLAAAINVFALLCALFFLFYRKFRSHEENITMASSSLDLSSQPRNMKHHVFPSFHGADVRESFLSHILKEFKSKAIDMFIDNDIERSKSIGPELIKAIKGSRIAIVFLSKNYASSTWCLDELVEIIKCREDLGQTVMALFYEVDPTDVRKQAGDFGKVFRKTCKGKTEEHIGRWKHALAEVAKIAGYHSTNWKNEAEMIERIAMDVSNALNNSIVSTDFDSLVGMESHMNNMKPLLLPDLEEVRMIGIYGPSGIGKTTIARSLFNQYSKDFQHSVFMENVKRISISNYSDNYSLMSALQEKFMSKITNYEGSKIPNLGVVKDRFKDKKVLVVLDDVDRLVQLEAMVKETSWFGPGSRIIITTQDRKLLQNGGFNHTYKMALPSSDEALQMFCVNAFGQKHPKDGFTELAREVTNIVGELPLGLRVMGSYFRGMSNQEEWKKVLPKLKTRLDGEIESILKFSYDALHGEDKSLFLHIACFFNYESVNEVEECLANSLLISDVTHGLNVLAEKSLISLDNGWVNINNLLIQLGKEIVRNQSENEPGKRQFLVDTRDIEAVLSDDRADINNVIGINLGTSSYIRESIPSTSGGGFERFYNLQFLKIEGRGVNPRTMNSISRKLRYLSWQFFPLPCLPSDFQPKFLVKLSMEHSKLEKLWEGIQPLGNLKWMDMNYSERLKELPDLSTAINLCELDLSYCSSLVELPSYYGNLINPQRLSFIKCSCLVKLPSSIGYLVNLQELDFIACSSLVELSSSIGNLIYLEKLNLSKCSSLVELPSSIGNLTNLKELNLEKCTRLVEIPSSIENLIDLKELYLTACKSLVEISSIGNLISLEKLHLSGCSNLVELPSSMKNLCGLWDLELVRCSKLEVCLTNINLESFTQLDLSDCSLLKIEDLKSSGTALKEVPSSIMPLLSELELSSCETQELGPWMGRKSRLRRLVLDNMQKLESLPQLPYSIKELDAVNCESLEKLDCSFRNPDICLNFTNCFKLNQEARDLIIQTRTNAYAVLPGGEVPACFTYRASGNSITVKLNQKPLCTSTKFKACFILAGEEKYVEGNVEVYCSITSEQNALSISPCKKIWPVLPKHLYTFEVEAMEVTSTKLFFEFELRCFNKSPEIKECGIFQLDGEASGERQCRDQEEHAKSTELVSEDDNRRQLHRD